MADKICNAFAQERSVSLLKCAIALWIRNLVDKSQRGMILSLIEVIREKSFYYLPVTRYSFDLPTITKGLLNKPILGDGVESLNKLC